MNFAISPIESKVSLSGGLDDLHPASTMNKLNWPLQRFYLHKSLTSGREMCCNEPWFTWPHWRYIVKPSTVIGVDGDTATLEVIQSVSPVTVGAKDYLSNCST